MQELDADARDRLMERLDVDQAPPVIAPDGSPWWEQLKFDPEGIAIEYQGESWRPEELCAADPGLASYAAAVLSDHKNPADINNRACALVFAEPSDLAEPTKLLEGISGKSLADDNLKLIRQHDPVIRQHDPAPAGA